MGSDVTITGATIAVLLPMLGVMSTVIVALYRLLIGRLTRAESQVDVGLASLEKLADHIDKLNGSQASQAESLAAMKMQHEAMLVTLTSLARRRGS